MTSYSNFSWTGVGIFAPPSSEQQLKVLGVEIPEGRGVLMSTFPVPTDETNSFCLFPSDSRPGSPPLSWLTDPAFGIPRRNQTGN